MTLSQRIEATSLLSSGLGSSLLGGSLSSGLLGLGDLLGRGRLGNLLDGLLGGGLGLSLGGNYR